MVKYLKKINLDYEDKENLKNKISITKKIIFIKLKEVALMQIDLLKIY